MGSCSCSRIDRFTRAAAARIETTEIALRLEFLEDLSPQSIATRLLALGADCDALCLTAADHPLVTEAVEALQARGLPVFAFIAPLSVAGRVHTIGLDN